MELNQFLLAAKINTYATNGEKSETKLEDGTNELIFQEDNFKYRDRYFGANPFIGQEIVWQNEQRIWGMNYYGQVLGLENKATLFGEFLNFLKLALRQIEIDKPYRGPAQFKDGHFEYFCECQGAIAKFIGSEKILYQGQEIYHLDFHGGSIK